MVRTRKTYSTPVPHQNGPTSQDNNAILAELRDLILDVRAKVNSMKTN